MEAICQVGRAIVARVLRDYVFAIARVRRSAPQLGAFALATAMLLASFSAAQALTGTSLTISHSPISSVFGQSVTFNVIVSSTIGTGTPTGTVAFSDGSPIGSATLTPGPGVGEAQATFTTTTLPVGNLTITATYGGDTNFSGNSISTPFSVSQANTQTTIISSQNPSQFGGTVTFTAIISPHNSALTGSVTFTDQTTSTTLGTVTVVNAGTPQAQLTVSTLAVGSHNIQASYSGDGNFNGSTGSLTQVVNKSNTTIQAGSTPNPSILGTNVTFTAAIFGTNNTLTGTVTFTDQTTGTTLGTVTVQNIGGTVQAQLSTTTLALGAHTILMSYSGDGNFNSSSATVVQVVTAGNTSTTTVITSQSPSTVGQSVTFTATVSGNGGTPTGTVTFTDLTTAQQLGTITLVNNGGAQQAVLTTAALPPGSHTIQAKYNGDANFGSSTGTVAQTVNKATPPTTLASSLNPSTFNQNVTFTLTVTGATGFTPTGSVTFTDQTTGQTLGTRFLGSFGGITATAFVSVSTLVAESHTIQASYAGDTNFNGTTTSNGVDRARPASVLASLRASTAD